MGSQFDENLGDGESPDGSGSQQAAHSMNQSQSQSRAFIFNG